MLESVKKIIIGAVVSIGVVVASVAAVLMFRGSKKNNDLKTHVDAGITTEKIEKNVSTNEKNYN